ncbi:MAG: porin [Paraburkholderia sp.]
MAGCTFATLGNAQSSITLYGVVDVGINYSSNTQTGVSARGAPKGASQVYMADGLAGGKMGSRWGLRGSEDLGDGTHAVFALENGFSINNGAFAQGGAEFGRQAWVGLENDRFGTVLLGRQYEFTTEYVGVLSSVTSFAGEFGTHPGNVDGLLNIRRVNNALKYQSPDFHGLSFGAIYGVGGQAGSLSQDSVLGAGIRYAVSGVSVGASYLDARNPNISIFGINPSAGGVTTNNIGSVGSATSVQTAPIISGFASARTMDEVALAGAYTIGAERVGVVFTRTAFNDLGDAGSGPNPLHLQGSVHINNAEANYLHRFTPAVSVGAAYDYQWTSDVGGSDGARYQQVSLGVDYALSKRTDVYALAAWQHASGTNSLGQPAVAQIGVLSPSATDHQVALTVGIAHRF